MSGDNRHDRPGSCYNRLNSQVALGDANVHVDTVVL